MKEYESLWSQESHKLLACLDLCFLWSTVQTSKQVEGRRKNMEDI